MSNQNSAQLEQINEGEAIVETQQPTPSSTVSRTRYYNQMRKQLSSSVEKSSGSRYRTKKQSDSAASPSVEAVGKKQRARRPLEKTSSVEILNLSKSRQRKRRRIQNEGQRRRNFIQRPYMYEQPQGSQLGMLRYHQPSYHLHDLGFKLHYQYSPFSGYQRSHYRY